MQFSIALIALVAGVASALPAAGSSSWDNTGDSQPKDQGKGQSQPPSQPQNQPKSHVTTTTAWAHWPQQTPAPAPEPKHTTIAAWNEWSNKAVQKNKALTAASPAPKPAFSKPAADLKNKLGSPPSDTCAWDFVLSCAQQAYQHSDSCLNVMAKGSDNCFSDNTCSSAIGSDAPTCATCYTSLGKEKFVKAIYEEKSDSDVAPVFDAMVSKGVCDSNGTPTKA